MSQLSVAVDAATVDLYQVLVNKEARVQRQQEWLKRHSQPLVSFSVNMPGPSKNNAMSQAIFNYGVSAVIAECASRGWTVTDKQVVDEPTGPEAIFVINAPSATLLKAAMIRIEHSHQLGRLMDLDVLDSDGKTISRSGHQMPRRKCFVCEDDAVICARSRRHDLDELLTTIRGIVEDA